MALLTLDQKQFVSDYIKFDLMTPDNVLVFSAFSWKYFKSFGRGSLVVEITLSSKKNGDFIKPDPEISYLTKNSISDPFVQSLIDKYDPKESFFITVVIKKTRRKVLDITTIGFRPKEHLLPENAFNALKNRPSEFLPSNSCQCC